MPPSHKRLLKEASELSASPSPHFHASPVHDNLFDWHFTLLGPPSPSPYAGGIYHGRIVLPPAYPLRPPSFRFLTPTGRFEVNREICLSISGHHEESWQPAWGIRTALTAIRSFMDGDAKGQVGGLDVPEEVRREYARRSGEWCCEVCGRCNRGILEEWRKECRERGVVDGEDEKEDEKAESTREGLKEPEQVSGDADAREDVDSRDVGASAKTSSLQEPAPAAVTSTSTSASASTSTSTSTPASSAQPPTSTTATRATTIPTPTTPASQSTHPDASQDGPWLDRAIVGVLIALVVMILRRAAHTED